VRWERHHIEIEESILTVLCQPEFVQAGVEAIEKTRRVISSYASCDRIFAETHAPHTPVGDAPALIAHMCRAGRAAGTGPMATVAGAVAEACVKAIIAAGACEAVADNGGDIALFIREPVYIGLYAGRDFPARMAFHVRPRPGVFGLCTSAGTVGHSHSYGLADAATVLSEDVLLADAAATALGNRIASPEDLEHCFDPLSVLPEMEGALAICQGRVALWGALPELMKMDVDIDLITRGRVPQVKGEV